MKQDYLHRLIILAVILVSSLLTNVSIAEVNNSSIYFTPFPEACTVRNCGFNCACFTLSYFRREVDASTLKNQLGVGYRLSEAASFFKLKSTFASYGLSAEGFKDRTSAEIFDTITDSRIAIVHLTGKSEKHFSVLYRTKNGLITLFDYPHPQISFDAMHVPPELISRMTGNVLYVAKTQTEISDTQYDSSTVISDVKSPERFDAVPTDHSVQQGVLLRVSKSVECDPKVLIGEFVVVHLPIENVGKSPVLISKAHGTCSCFQGMQPNSIEVQPGEKSEVVLKFIGSRFDKSSGTQIALETNDPKLSVCNIHITPKHNEKQDGNVLIPFFTASLGGGNINVLKERTVRFSLLCVKKPDSKFEIKDLRYNKALVDAQTSSSEETFGDAVWNKIDVIVNLKPNISQGYFDIPIVITTTHNDLEEYKFVVNGYVL